MAERRRFIRFKLLLEGEASFGNKREFSQRMQLTDFSRGGLRFLIPQIACLKADLVTLKIYLPDSNIPVSIQGGVRWMRAMGERCEVGMEIEKIRPADKGDILDYVYKVWRKKEIS